MSRFIAVMPAGGSSRRASDHPLVKQHKSKLLVPFNGVPVVVKTLNAFQAAERFAYVVLAVPADLQTDFQKLLHQHQISSDFVRLVAGGVTRQSSVCNALKLIQVQEPDRDNLFVVVHDAARCFVSPHLLQQACTEVLSYNCVSAAIAVTDTIVEVTEHNTYKSSLPREFLRAVQTPQAFKYKLLLDAHEAGGVEATDDTTLVAAQGHEVHYFEGEVRNRKLTNPEDFLDMNI
jgi:2-C-methyl-D-erythritol 4-phosphate cytidylyltransferase